MMEQEELSSILMRIIRTLSESDSGEKREEQKMRLQAQFRESDHKVDQLVLKKQKELSKVMQMYARVSNRLNQARVRIQDIKSGLIRCKELLHCKRNDLKELWLEGVQQKHILDLLESVQDVKQSPEKFDTFLTDENYLEATDLLVKTQNKLKNDLKDIEGLVEVRSAVGKRKEKLYRCLMEDLGKLLHYSFEKNILKDGDIYGYNRSIQNEAIIRNLNISDEHLEQFLGQPYSVQNCKQDATHRLILVVECLFFLGKLENAIETLKIDQFNEMQSIIQKSTKKVNQTGKNYSGHLLMVLFSLIVDQFLLVAQQYDIMARTMVKIASRKNTWIPVKLEQAEVWEKIQTAVKTMLTEYLDFDNKLAIHQPSKAQFSEPTSDINSYFVRRSTKTRTKKSSLFRFNASSTGISMHELATEVSVEKKESSDLICPPNPHNVTSIYSCLMDFIVIIEKSMKYEPGKHCTLYGFLMDYIKDVFLGQIHADHGDALNEASLLLDSWKAITDVEVLRDYKAHKPLLKSAAVVKKAIEELLQYMIDLPLYNEQFLTMICTTVMQYKEICLASYRGLVQPESEDKRIISAQWAKDEEMSKYLKSLSNWNSLRNSQNFDMLEHVDQRSLKETKVIKAKLGDHSISGHEILQDANQIRSLGLLHESLEWFSGGVTHIAVKLQRSNDASIGNMHKLPANSIQTLLSLAKEFEDIANTCLLIIHLEVRLHCYYYLSPLKSGSAGALFHGGPDSTDPHQEVTRLNSDLLAIEEVLNNSIDEKKIVYVFEGVSSLIADILMDSIINIRKINKNGVKKMCRNVFSIQHTLTSNITGSRETSLDLTKQYYEMLNLRPQDVLNEVLEKGPVFTVENYVHVLELLHRSDPTSSVDIHQKYVKRLQDITKRIGIAV